MRGKRASDDVEMRILQAMANSKGWWQSSAITRAAGLPPGSIGPTLIGMWTRGLLESNLPAGDASSARRLFKITAKGIRLANSQSESDQ